MEQLLHYVWKHKIFPLSLLQTTSGRPVEVIDPGLPNMNAGPDFFNAKLKIDGTGGQRRSAYAGIRLAAP